MPSEIMAPRPFAGDSRASDTMIGKGRSMKLRPLLRLLPLMAGVLCLFAAVARGAEPGTVIVLPTTGVVDQVMANYLRDGITRASASGAPAVVIRIDTPGGSLEATREIVKAELEAPLP